MKFVKLLLATALMTASISPAFANPAVQILGASYGGSGCPIAPPASASAPTVKNLPSYLISLQPSEMSRRKPEKLQSQHSHQSTPRLPNFYLRC